MFHCKVHTNIFFFDVFVEVRACRPCACDCVFNKVYCDMCFLRWIWMGYLVKRAIIFIGSYRLLLRNYNGWWKKKYLIYIYKLYMKKKILYITCKAPINTCLSSWNAIIINVMLVVAFDMQSTQLLILIAFGCFFSLSL